MFCQKIFPSQVQVSDCSTLFALYIYNKKIIIDEKYKFHSVHTKTQYFKEVKFLMLSLITSNNYNLGYE